MNYFLVSGGEPVLSDAAAALGPVSSGWFGSLQTEALFWFGRGAPQGPAVPSGVLSYVVCSCLDLLPAFGCPFDWPCQCYCFGPNTCGSVPAELGVRSPCLQGSVLFLSIMLMVSVHPSIFSTFHPANSRSSRLHYTTSKHKARTSAVSQCWESPRA